MMNMEIKSITMNSGCVDILVDTKSNKKRVFVAKLNDFDEVGTGQLVETKKKKVGYTYLFRFELTERFDAFHDGLLKLIIADPRFHLPQQTLYFIIYSLDMFEEYDDDKERVESYFNDAEERKTKNVVKLKDKPKKTYDQNGYHYIWLDVKLNEWGLEYTSNHRKLFAEYLFTYKETKGNVLEDLEFYITTNNGTIIYSNSYLFKDGQVPNKIDIWADGKEHQLRIGPVFPIKENDDFIQNGMRLTMSYKDKKQGYYVRRTYVLKDEVWFDEELFALPI